ncbi:cysteine--1-D-myo-inosityl 2-amino-2-deoxy-alpha-D-glucopyranoside ligase [Subtercola sp. PAMC28395]|uniref:cysteine--1-D-myo-inosityl 2-amino-2-deoxy-alpha-D-glucopyranoside ligase n=1 Tax=Subtercola sp. PAMC28395 TaxID=2846775 RepID=UPI001C0C219A|nr:cysteine--1-D-myo-inosityl 2-amino-2-deoxy-alpha-D-glucopyranoside ligase [Subtercola sp. PAMC28395]QWT23246.1 cysteine--1-D-myo-inosityl 2-amino-2-deoxy-alpha-D-glucopyranoside ligase [Subtercola sp. PAMC28395]
MHSWPRPDVPSLRGTGPVPHIFNQASGTVDEARATDGVAGLYVCGITPYDATHLGHASTYLAFDTLNRLWLDAGYTVNYAQNVTDIDDPLLERATATGVDWRELAESQTDLFRADMTALRVIPPQNYVAVTDVIDDIAAAAAELLGLGFAYQVETPDALHPGARDLYFDSEQTAHATSWFLGLESRYDHSTMLELFAQRGGDPDRPGKRHVLDPLVWRVARADEPQWPAPESIGAGRPGWHIECSVIAVKHLGPDFAVQGGGSDLIFPHHEYSAAHATALTGQPFASIHAHSGMVAYQGEKMSKSLGNLVLVSKLRESGVDTRVIRLALLAHHYRSDWEYTDADLDQAGARLAAYSVPTAAGEPDRPKDERADALVAALRSALRDDLGTPGALALLDEYFGSVDETSALVFEAMDALLGIRVH